jgi:hypothetical protein
MKKTEANLPIFMQDQKTREILRDASSCIPDKARAYIVGGAIRNSVYYRLFKEKMPQRDYDLLFIGDRNLFIRNLLNHGFVYGHMRRKSEVVLKKKKIPKPRIDILTDYVFLDIHISTEKNVIKNLKHESNFTINGFAILLKDADSEEWYEQIIALPRALQDLKNKKLRVNAIKHPAGLFACLRFMSIGFKPPSKKEVKDLLLALGKLGKYKYERNIKKTLTYVGGENRAKQLAKKIGINKDIFDFKVIKSLGKE